MTTTLVAAKDSSPPAALLRAYSVEVTAKDRDGINAVCSLAPPDSDVFVANLPNDGMDRLITTCAQLRWAGLNPVPHLVARNIPSRLALEDTLQRLVGEADVHQALLVGGDRDQAVGPYASTLEVLQTGLIEKSGLKTVAIGCHPEGHPRVADAVLWPALLEKLHVAAEQGLQTFLVSQFALEAEPYVRLARRLRDDGVTAPLRVGVAGPTTAAKLMKFALMCGVGASMRALKERQDFAKSAMGGETPEALLRDLAAAHAAEPHLGLGGVHFFTFGSVGRTIALANEMAAAGASRAAD